MTKLPPFVLTTALLCGCPGAKVPKIPPHAPAPKLLMDDKKKSNTVTSLAGDLDVMQFANRRVPAINHELRS